MNKRYSRTTRKEDVERTIQEEWDAITEEEILELIDSIPIWIQVVIVANGGHT